MDADDVLRRRGPSPATVCHPVAGDSADARRRAMLERESSRACNGANVFAVAILAVVVASARIAWLEHARMGGWAEIPVLPASLPIADFERDYVGTLSPVILRGAPNPFASGWSLPRLADACGDGMGYVFRPSATSTEWGGFEPSERGSHAQPLKAFVARLAELAPDCAAARGSELECGQYLFDFNLRCACPAFLETFELLPHFGGDLVPLTQEIESPWPVLIVGGAGSRSALHVDNSFLPFWLTVLEGRKRFRVVTLPDWQQYLANASAGAPYFTAEGANLRPLDGFDDAVVERELIARGATVWSAELRPGDTVYVPTGALHGGLNLEAGGEPTVAITANFLDAAHAAQVREMCRRYAPAGADGATMCDEMLDEVTALRDDEGLPWSTPPAEGASYLDWLFQSPARARLACAPDAVSACPLLREACRRRFPPRPKPRLVGLEMRDGS
jgi:hypothetical protein